MKHIRNRYFLASDVVLVLLAAYASYVLRIENLDLSSFKAGPVIFALAAVVVTPLLFKVFGLYSRYWRYASIEELALLSGVMTLSALAAGGFALLVTQVTSFQYGVVPRSVPFIWLLLGLVVTAGPRFAVRAYAHYYQKHSRASDVDAARVRVAIMGAGDAGAMIVREMQRNPQLGLDVVGFLDDDPAKHGAWIHGVRVLGNRDEILHLADRHHVSQVVIAMPTVPGKVVREIVRLCEQAGVRAKIVPGIYELIDGAVSVRQLRDVDIEDLLRREPVHTDTTAVAGLLRGRRVLITGGGGSIGSELCRQVLRCHPAELVILGHGENSVFEIHGELGLAQDAARAMNVSGEAPARLHTVIADIRDAQRMRQVFERYRPEVVFHAAAHKHVPLMELNPAEAVTNNILGTRNVLDTALATGVERFIMISTDKAVNPTSMMGVTKRAAEMLVLRAAETSEKPYVAVRFGNVLGSRGSVVLTFKRQIAAGGPVTVTHPDMVRYFMTIPEAVQLVLQATVLGRGGEVFVLDMGEPVRIVDLARDLIELSGLKVGRDIDIAFSGVRPGEKLKEELFLAGERYARTEHEKVFTAVDSDCPPPCDLDTTLEMLQEAAECDDEAAILRLLQGLIPEFRAEANAPASPAAASEPVVLAQLPPPGATAPREALQPGGAGGS